MASERSSGSQVDGDGDPNRSASRDAASLIEGMRDRLLARWAQALGATAVPERVRLGATLDRLVDNLNMGQQSASAESPVGAQRASTRRTSRSPEGDFVTPGGGRSSKEDEARRPSELSELRAQVIALADEDGAPLAGATSVALHREIDALMAREAFLSAMTEPASGDDATFHDRFLALLGHDLRNPISAVKLATSILSRDTQSPEARRRTLQRVTSNTDRLLRTLEDSLDYSRLFQGRELAFEAAPLDLDATSRGVLTAIEAAYPTRTFFYESPGVVESVLDKERFIRLLSNLLVAAVEHAAPDSETRLKLTQEGEIRITVECTGFELSKEELDHLFDSPLAAPSDKTRRSRGFGVGLFVAQKTVAQQGGSLRAEALTPVGTAFILTLPLAI